MDFGTFVKKYTFLFVGDTPLSEEQEKQINNYGWLALKETGSCFPDLLWQTEEQIVPPYQNKEKDGFVPYYNFNRGEIHQAWLNGEEILVVGQDDDDAIRLLNNRKKIFIIKEEGSVYNYTRGVQDFFTLVTLSGFYARQPTVIDIIPMPLEIIEIAGYKFLYYLSSIFPTTDSKYRQEQLTLYETKLAAMRQKYLMKKQQNNKWVNKSGVLDNAKSSLPSLTEILNSLPGTVSEEKFRTFIEAKTAASKEYDEKMREILDEYLKED